VFFAVSLVADEVLNSSAVSACIHDLVDVPFLGHILGDNRAWASWFSIGEKEWVVGDVALEKVHMKTGEGVRVVGEFECVL
jgi:hypothetical protein